VFTGLVETKGKLVRRTARGRDARLLVSGELGGEPIALGESIAVDGVCLTVAALAESGVLEFDASSETLARTTLGEIAPGDAVNLERAVPLGARMGGHIVSGHVDGTGRVVETKPLGAALEVTFEAPAELARFLAPKGSICVSGVSLTVNGVSGGGERAARFDVVLVPHTREKTSLDGLRPGSKVNVEVDVLARYVARLLECGRDATSSDATLLEQLAKAKFI
jgi:riboflavin synthase